MDNLKQLLITTYTPLVHDFINIIKDIQYDNIPEPFLPLCGKLYPKAEKRIMFIGMETRGYGNISDFVSNYNANPEETILSGFEEFDDFEFCNWGNNSGTSFWDFNLKFLSYYYGIDDWKRLKKGETTNILQSFAWANVNSIERYQITAEKKGVKYEDWLYVKEASRKLDKSKYLIDIFRPNIMVITHWDTSEEWLTTNSNESTVREEIEEHLWYYFLPQTQTHVLWTAHPTWLARNKDFDEYVKFLVNLVKKRLD